MIIILLYLLGFTLAIEMIRLKNRRHPVLAGSYALLSWLYIFWDFSCKVMVILTFVSNQVAKFLNKKVGYHKKVLAETTRADYPTPVRKFKRPLKLQ
jgi:hypothetical protein